MREKYWAVSIGVTDLRAALQAEGTPDVKEALRHLRGKRGKLNFSEAMGHAPPHVQAAIQHAGRRVLAGAIADWLKSPWLQVDD